MLSGPGELTFEQEAKLAFVELQDPGTRISGWHYPSEGPMLIRSCGDWQSVQPDGRLRTLARSTEGLI